MPSLGKQLPSGKKYWRSLDELADTPEFREFMHREFPAGASELLDSGDRRHFLKIMGASMALAGMGLSGCRRWPQEQIAPFAHRPAGILPGVPKFYASSMELGGVAHGLLVTSYDGRPVKIEGNPEHPISRGGTDVFSQASVLDMYDPDRSKHVLHNHEQSDWDSFGLWVNDHFGSRQKSGGQGLRILSEASDSPSIQAQKRSFLEAFPQAKWHEYEPINNDAEVEGSMLAFGAAYRTLNDFSEARIIVSLDSDFLGVHPAATKHIRDFASTRRAMDANKTMSRLYVFEGGLSLTGANADQREAVRSGDIGAVAAWLARRILHNEDLRRFETSEAGKAVFTPHVLAELENALSDLEAHHGESIVTVGPNQPAEVHLLGHLMNQALGNVGRTVSYIPRGEVIKHVESMTNLVADMNNGEVDTLIIIGGNPVYDAPADLNFEAGLGKVQDSVHLAFYHNETSLHCTWHLNRAHYLEAWGDGRAWDGTLTICQPLIEPLFKGRSSLELLELITTGSETKGYDIVRRTFAAMTGMTDYEQAWRSVLHDGFMRGSAITQERPGVSDNRIAGAVDSLFNRFSSGDRATWDVIFVGDMTMYDGRFANNGWLQELPDPLSKLTWDNAAIISPASADALGVMNEDLISITCGDYALEAPVLVLPGIADHSVQVSLGYGCKFEGRIAAGAGFNAYGIRDTQSMNYAAGATVHKNKGSYPLAVTQDHHAIDVESVGGKGIQERLPTLVREATIVEYRKNPQFANDQDRRHVVHRLSLFSENHAFHTSEEGENTKYAWGMSIDLSSCVGCGACIIACQAENNIPIVGKDQIIRGREMHWLRIDRYYTFEGGVDKPDVNRLKNVVLQPVACQHCENAPCEQVCPVAATTHDSGGLNVMVYNRCVGTRYCANNCPYKVRRFNYFDYHRREPRRETGLLHVKKEYFMKEQADAGPLKQMQFNPEVTVRMRGIMEKCSYCIQRISDARIKTKNDWVNTAPEKRTRRVTISDGSFTTACAQACPAEAIVFGDLNDNASRVAQLHGHERSYEMLEILNVKPRTRYMAKLRNPSQRASESTGSSSEAAVHG